MEQLIYIEQNDKKEATKMARSFTNFETRKRAYINTLGTELAIKYLAQEGINVNNIYHMHSINKIREEFDIADIMLPNIHIDVRVVYDKDLIFIPKSHFEYNLLPDIYLAFKISEDLTHVEFLGFFEPKLINKNNQNEKYYFIEKEKLSNPIDLKNYIETFNGNTTESLPEDVIENAERMAMSLIDDNISNEDKKSLLALLTKSADLREELTEFDNFEWISYHTANKHIIEEFDEFGEYKTLETDETTVVTDEFDLFQSSEDFDNFDSDNTQEDLTEPEDTEITIETDTVDNTPETTDEVEENITNSIVDESINVIETTTEDDLAGIDPVEIAIEPEDLTETDTVEAAMTEELTEIAPTEELFGETLEIPLESISLEPELNVQQNIEALDDIVIENSLDSTNEETSIPSDIFTETFALENLDPTPQESAEIEQPTIEEVVDTIQPESANTIITENIDTSNEVLQTIADNSTNLNDSESPQSFENLETLFSFETEDAEKYDDSEGVTSLDSLFITDENNSEDSFDEEAFLNSLVSENESSNKSEKAPTGSKITSYENSTIISNTQINPGEILIDINQEPDGNYDESGEIGMLYNEDKFNFNANKPEKGKKALIAASVIITTIAALLIFGSINKPDNQLTEQNNANSFKNNIPEALDKNIPEASEQTIPENIEKIVPKAEDKAKIEKAVKEAKAELKKPKTPPIITPYLEVQKITWSVPDYLSYNENFKHYIQTAGKSLKLSLSSDLLLATEYAYSNQIHVNINLSKEGMLKDVKIQKSSGSDQIDNIVLRTVKETLNVVKAPSGVVVGDNVNLTLKIYL